jgi:hypothetical protein
VAGGAGFGAGSTDMWVLKLDISGNVFWQKTYGGTEYDFANAIQQTSDGGYIVAGETESFPALGRNMMVLKLDGNGNIGDCQIIGTSDAIIADTNSTVNNPTFAVASTCVTPQMSDAIVITPSVEVERLCYVESPVIPLPLSQEIFCYAASSSPVLGIEPSKINPIGVGSVATGGNILNLEVGVERFAGPVDMEDSPLASCFLQGSTISG